MSHLQTGFLPGPSGSLHVALFHPGLGGASSHWVLHVPAFGEEMNKSRHMVARQARALAAQGMTVLIPDLFGTGDSAGNLEQATWQGWLDDISYLMDWARRRGADQLTLWGHRMGCLLAACAAQSLETAPYQLLFWQPVHSGKQHMAQFLRLRIAAGMVRDSAETVAQLRQSLLLGEPLEVAGYRLPAGLFADIESVALAEFAVPTGLRVRILEVASEAGKPVLPVTAKLVENWHQSGIDCQAETAPGNPFWMTQELGFAPDLIAQTSFQLLTPDSTANVGCFEPVAGDLGQKSWPLPALPATSQDLVQSMVFNCGDDQLAGILHRAGAGSTRGVLIVVGGPQYRAGSHRQFVHLARYLAAQGIPVMRFDYRGMGDSAGELKGFRHIGPDIRSAIDAFQAYYTGLADVVIWGLCDAATAAVFYAASDSRVTGLVLANPWVYSPGGAARAYVKHYYIQRILQPEFWRKVLSGKFNVSSSAKSAWDLLRQALSARPATELPVTTSAEAEVASAANKSTQSVSRAGQHSLANSFADSLSGFTGKILFIFSGNDLTAAEFLDAARGNSKLLRLMQREKTSQVILPGVDHTFSTAEWRGKVEVLSGKLIERS